jgi:hypothetical protein
MWRPIGRAIEIRQGIGGGRTYEGQGEESQGNNDRRRSARGPVKCRRIQCLSHLRPLRYKASRKFPHRTNKRAVAWTIQRRLLRDCPTKAVSNHGLIWLIIGYRRAAAADDASGSSASCIMTPGVFRPGAENPAPSRQAVRHEVVTHVLGTFCDLCVRAGQVLDWRAGKNEDGNYATPELPNSILLPSLFVALALQGLDGLPTRR